MTNTLFVYGTLVGNYENAKNATLTNARKEGLCVTPDPESEVKGEVIEVDDEELAALDRYEGTPTNYKRVDIDNGIEVYVGNPEYRRVDHDYENLEDEFADSRVVIK